MPHVVPRPSDHTTVSPEIAGSRSPQLWVATPNGDSVARS